ncbi:Hypothetical predicted protein [Mytilus galloprovincialis]|uniref:DZIP3-like HEPN domain-containing protein n=1 Tax=Mytilus galloprovincialis TaxID=29158 RepID=A0A8B6C7X8_MYTGA|nr:Hypothetical predicted protein [Mytilus galloprovincialis]
MAAVSEREDRFIRIKKLVDLGTEALRKVVDTKLLPPAKLQKKLKELEPSLTNRISRQQRNILYPRGGDPARSCDMDLTLLVFVLRNAVFDKPVSGYGCLPDDNDRSFPANVTRLQFYRNKLGHTVYHTLEEHEFRKISHTLKMIIKSFEIPGFPGYDDQIRCIITGSLDYRANSFSWHAQKAFRLAPSALNGQVIQPAVKQHKKHPYVCSFCYGTGLSYGAHKMRCTYCSLFQQENTVNISSSQGIPVSDSEVSKTKTKRSDSSRSYAEHNFDAINKTKNMRVWQQDIRRSSFNDQRSSCFQIHTNLYMMQREMICKSSMNNSLIRFRPTSTPSVLRDQTNSISHTSVQNVSQSDLNQNVTSEKRHEPATKESYLFGTDGYESFSELVKNTKMTS